MGDQAVGEMVRVEPPADQEEQRETVPAYSGGMHSISEWV